MRRINLLAPVNGLPAGSNPQSVPDGLAAELINRGLAVAADPVYADRRDISVQPIAAVHLAAMRDGRLPVDVDVIYEMTEAPYTWYRANAVGELAAVGGGAVTLALPDMTTAVAAGTAGQKVAHRDALGLGPVATMTLAEAQASVSGARVAGDGTYALADAINSPLEIGSVAAWFAADRGPVKADWTPCAADGDAVATWPDLSGNARHATPQAGTPTFSVAGGKNGKPAVNIGAVCRLATPAFVTSGYGNALTIFIVSKASTTLHSSLKIKASISSTNFWIGNTGTTGARDCTMNGLTGFSQVVLSQPTLDGIDCIGVGATEVRHLLDGFSALVASNNTVMRSPISAGSIPFTSGTLIIGGLSSSSTYDWPGNISEIIVFNKYLTDSEFRRVYGYLAKKYIGIPTVNILGNSLSSGTGSTGGPNQTPQAGGNNLPSLLAASLGATARVRTDAYPGRTAVQIFNESQAFSALTLTTSPKTISVVWELTNSMATQGSVYSAYEDYVRVCRAKRANGGLVVAATCLYRGDTGNNAKNTAYTNAVNALVRANWSTFADGLADVAADARMQDYNNTTYFAADKIHLTDAGYVVAESIFRPVILALL